MMLMWFMLRMKLTSSTVPDSLLACVEFMLNQAQETAREFFFPLTWLWNKSRDLLPVSGLAGENRMAKLHQTAVCIVVTASVVSMAFVSHAERYAVRLDPSGHRVSQLIGPDGAVINVVDSAWVTIPSWWRGKAVQVQMSNGRTQVLKLQEDRVSAILARA